MAMLSNGKHATSNEAAAYADSVAGATYSDARALVVAHDQAYAPALATMSEDTIKAYMARQLAEREQYQAKLDSYERPSYARHIKTRTEGDYERGIKTAAERAGSARLALALIRKYGSVTA